MSYVSFTGIEDADKEPLFYHIIEAHEAGTPDPYVYQVPANLKAVGLVKGYDDYASHEQQAAEMLAEKVHTDWDCPSGFEFIVTDPEGRRWRCDVTVDYDPVFSAGSERLS